MKCMINVLRKSFLINICLFLLLTGCTVKHKGEASGSKNHTKKPKTVMTQQQSLVNASGFHHLQPSLSKNIVVYFNPHADDEVLTFGIPIRNDVVMKKKVYVVLISPGEDSIARDVINGRYDKESFHPYMAGKPVWCNFHKGFHIPAVEGYKQLTKFAFGRERVTEFIRSTSALGVPKEQLFYYTLPNGHFGYNKGKAIMKDWASMFPNATFKTMSKRDIHIDHAILGKVMNDLHKKKTLRNTVHYVSVATKMTKRNKDYQLIKLKKKQDSKMINIAIDVYRKWNPKDHYFGLGFHSVPTQFEYLQQNMSGYKSFD